MASIFDFCEGLGIPTRKVREATTRMERTPSTMVIHNNVDGAYTRFSAMSGPLANKNMLKWLVVIRRCTYQATSEDRRWAYELVSYLWPYVYYDSDYSDHGSSDEGIKRH